MKLSNGLSVWVGLPGSGKTSVAVYACKKFEKKEPNRYIYSNVPIIGTYKYDNPDLGHKAIENGLIIFDEAGITEFGRNFKKNMNDTYKLEFLKKYRHHDIYNFMVFSQAVDFDKVYYDLAESLHILKKVGPWSVVWHYRRAITGFDSQTGKPIMGWKLQFFPWDRLSLIFRPPTYKYFDSYERMELEPFELVPWTKTTRFAVDDLPDFDMLPVYKYKAIVRSIPRYFVDGRMVFCSFT